MMMSVSEALRESVLTTVMYHYVGEPDPRFPQRRQTSSARFVRQLTLLARAGVACDLPTVVDALSGGSRLPPRAFLLTFDDGLRDHVETVLPVLRRLGLPAAFFVSVGSLAGRVLPVHRIQSLLALGQDTEDLFDELAHFGRQCWGRDGWDRLCAGLRVDNRLDEPRIALLKCVLQQAPDPFRADALNHLCAGWPALDETRLARQLYLTQDDLLRMVDDDGMAIGGHGDRHEWLAQVDAVTLANELDASRDLVQACGAATRTGWAFAYPYGDADARVAAGLRDRGCAVAFTTAPGPMRVGFNPLLLPRLDCVELNDGRDDDNG